jgi:hypothetical protein
MKLPVDNRLKVEKMIEDGVIQGEKRGYLGLSQIGKECPRALWYDFRFCSKNEFSPRLARLFARGHREEPIIIADLEKIGVKVHSDQAEVVCGHGHIKGHIDGAADNVPDAPKTTHLLEFKTMAEKYFKILQAKGLKESNPVYYAQCQCYMLLMDFSRTLFISVNKNTDARYYERIKLDKPEARDYIRRGETIIFDEHPAYRVESYKCKWCNHKPICKEGAIPEKNCRTCQHADMEDKGEWSCQKYPVLFDMMAVVDCKKYELLKTLKP